MSHPKSLNRRDFVQGVSLLGLSTVVPRTWVRGQTAAAGMPPLNRFPRMMQEWLSRQVEQHRPLVNSWKTKEEAETYVKEVRRRMHESFGPLPEKTPLNPKVTRVEEREGYRVESLVFESRPGYFVSGNLYLPSGLAKGEKRPGIVGLCGHSITGKSVEYYQSYAQALGRLGHVCLIIDPIGQGERLEWPNGWGKTTQRGPTGEHIQLGNPMTLVGEFIGTWFAWDGMRALDYLLTRDEVDPQHLGVTGLSGGGTQTAWMMALDERWTMAAPACFITTLQHNADNELPADSEQCPPHFLKLRLDHLDCVAAMAPKPVMILAQERDFFDVRGTLEAYETLKRLYAALGKPDNLKLYVGPDHHTMSQSLREAMYGFFHEVTGVGSSTKEPNLTLESDQELWVAPEGDVKNLGSKSLSVHTQGILKKLLNERPTFATNEQRIAKLNELLVLAKEWKAPKFRILRPHGGRNYPSRGYTTYALKTEDEIEVLCTRLTDDPGHISRPLRDHRTATLYVSHRSHDQELREQAWLKDLASETPPGHFYACDVRGIGDSLPDTCGKDQFDNPYGSHYFYAAHSFMLGRPLIGQRTEDVLKVMKWLQQYGYEEIHLVGCGWGALVATFAALNEPKVKTVRLRNALSSYQTIVEDRDYAWPDAMMIPHVLKWMDLPDLYQALGEKLIANDEPWGSRDGYSQAS